MCREDCKDPVSTGHSGTGFRVSGMLTAFWTARALLRQAKSYYPTWESPVAMLKPSNVLSFNCVCVCVWRQAEEGRESSSRFTVSVSSCVCQCRPEAFQCHPVGVIIHRTLLPFSALLIHLFLQRPIESPGQLTWSTISVRERISKRNVLTLKQKQVCTIIIFIFISHSHTQTHMDGQMDGCMHMAIHE